MDTNPIITQEFLYLLNGIFEDMQVEFFDKRTLKRTQDERAFLYKLKKMFLAGDTPEDVQRKIKTAAEDTITTRNITVKKTDKKRTK